MKPLDKLREVAKTYKTLHNLDRESTMSSCHESIDTCDCDTATNYRMTLNLIRLESEVAP